MRGQGFEPGKSKSSGRTPDLCLKITCRVKWVTILLSYSSIEPWCNNEKHFRLGRSFYIIRNNFY